MTKRYKITAFKIDKDGIFETSRETNLMIVAIFNFISMSIKYPDVDIFSSRRPQKRRKENKHGHF